MENNHDIDKQFNEASAKALDEPETFPSFEKVWDKIEEKLDKKAAKKRIIPMWIPYGIAASLIIGFGALYFTKEEKITASQQTNAVMTKNSVSSEITPVSVPENIKKIDEKVKENIQKEIKVTAPKVIAFNGTPAAMPVPTIAASPVYEAKAEKYMEPVIVEKKDSFKEKNIEEVIAMGIKRDKNSVLNSSYRVSSNDGYPTNVNSVEDTAQSIRLDSFDKKDPIAILGYSKTLVKAKSFKDKNILGEKISNKSMANSIQGSAAGFSNNYVSGNLGSGSIMIRGNSSVKDSEALYLINGAISDAKSFKNLDPNKIVAITVLKGANIIAIYGSKAANGVIVVETKDISKSEKKKIDELKKIGSSEK
ncbi:TonB-dependent outer membrane receptor, SusC/RagA subfamily, signature region [Chryseobacterium soldanellicola]|uniref:TonB-dependent outer membrane receptor, SusC/RagA subfamily, signature region n=1 Tax=Chryseobacterium soldanellicola TaxID=311333 RepID=A0A1H1CPQ7_9FLAO|nr:TonB-dependent receptor plug domain-containing protein [Chryseobacterium soldanellicola]SDQ65868.1 TonB-dependent outer membrane receptor, SusC/RagA subfamily, signature region [Chryseobacterium soldanellicola]